jgi:hypothetical protein
MKNQNLKLKERIKVTIVLFSNNCYPLVDVYNLLTIVNELQCSNISQHKKWATTQQAYLYSWIGLQKNQSKTKNHENLVDIGKFQTMNWKLYSQICNEVAQKASKGSCFKMSSTSFQLYDGWCVRVSTTKFKCTL